MVCYEGFYQISTWASSYYMCEVLSTDHVIRMTKKNLDNDSNVHQSPESGKENVDCNSSQHLSIALPILHVEGGAVAIDNSLAGAKMSMKAKWISLYTRHTVICPYQDVISKYPDHPVQCIMTSKIY